MKDTNKTLSRTKHAKHALSMIEGHAKNNKFEARNRGAKQIQMIEPNSNVPSGKDRLQPFEISAFEFYLATFCFGFRYSDFEFYMEVQWANAIK